MIESLPLDAVTARQIILSDIPSTLHLSTYAQLAYPEEINCKLDVRYFRPKLKKYIEEYPLYYFRNFGPDGLLTHTVLAEPIVPNYLADSYYDLYYFWHGNISGAILRTRFRLTTITELQERKAMPVFVNLGFPSVEEFSFYLHENYQSLDYLVKVLVPEAPELCWKETDCDDNTNYYFRAAVLRSAHAYSYMVQKIPERVFSDVRSLVAKAKAEGKSVVRLFGCSNRVFRVRPIGMWMCNHGLISNNPKIIGDLNNGKDFQKLVSRYPEILKSIQNPTAIRL